MLALLLVALSLGLSNFAASAGIGAAGVNNRTRLRIAVTFGFFETVMPVLGLLLGHGLAGSLGGASRWLGGGLLMAAGLWPLAAMAAARGGGRRPRPPRPLSGWRLVVTGAALSLDNLTAGFALGTYHVGLALAAAVIGAVSVALSLLGLELGGRLGALAGGRGEFLSGLILAGAGAAILAGAL